MRWRLGQSKQRRYSSSFMTPSLQCEDTLADLSSSNCKWDWTRRARRGIMRHIMPQPSRSSGHCATRSLLRASPGWPSVATRVTHALRPWSPVRRMRLTPGCPARRMRRALRITPRHVRTLAVIRSSRASAAAGAQGSTTRRVADFLRQIEHQHFGCTAAIDADLCRFGDLERIASAEFDAVHPEFTPHNVYVAFPARL